MGLKEYSEAIDIWSCGCVFGEMMLCKPIFPGTSELDQLFKIFHKVGTPSADSWSGFTNMPNYSFEFPNFVKVFF